MFIPLLLASTLFVTNEREGSVMAIDTTTQKIVHRTVVGTRTRGIVFSPDRKRLFVAVSHFKGKPWKTTDDIVEIDAATLKVVRRYRGGTDPEGIAIAPDGHRVVVSNEDAGTD